MLIFNPSSILATDFNRFETKDQRQTYNRNDKYEKL